MLPSFNEIERTLKTQRRIDFFILYACEWDDCVRSFSDRTTLANHVHDDHIVPHKEHNKKNKLKGCRCLWRTCGYIKSFRSFYNLEMHIGFKHTRNKPYACDECEWRFVQRSDLESHMSIHEKRQMKRAKNGDDDEYCEL